MPDHDVSRSRPGTCQGPAPRGRQTGAQRTGRARPALRTQL